MNSNILDKDTKNKLRKNIVKYLDELTHNNKNINQMGGGKVYTEEEVQRMIRDRLSRGRYAQEQQHSPQVTQDAKDFKADPESSESWEEQLATFIDNRVEQRERKFHESQWKEQENKIK
jgi:hypothetical protein